MPLPFTARSLDPDAAAFCARSGASDRAALSAFVRGVKDLGLWESMVCWPLRSSQNAGYGDTVHSLGGLGTYNGTRVNAPAWGNNGLAYSGASQSVSTSLTVGTLMANGGTVFGVMETAPEDNFPIFIADAAVGVPSSANLSANFQLNIGVVPFVSRGNPATRYFQITRGGAFAAGFNSVAGVVRQNSQANFRNGVQIANETGLNDINPTGTIDRSIVGGRGNGPNGIPAHSITLLSTSQLSNQQVLDLHNLYKQTLGAGLGLP